MADTDITRGKGPIEVRLTTPTMVALVAAIGGLVSIGMFVRSNQVDILALRDAAMDAKSERRAMMRTLDSLGFAHYVTRQRLENLEAAAERSLQRAPRR